MGDSTEDLEPLFDYSSVQPLNFFTIDDDDSDASPSSLPKRRKLPEPVSEKVDEDVKVIKVVDCEEEEDWLPLPPKVSHDLSDQLGEDSTIKELRLKRQELLTFAKSVQNVFREVDEPAKRELDRSSYSSIEAVAGQPSKLPCERAKIVISIQDKDGQKQFRVYMDDKLERLFKTYAERVKLDQESLVFCFDGDKINAEATPASLGMEDDDIIEVHWKKS